MVYIRFLKGKKKKIDFAMEKDRGCIDDSVGDETKKEKCTRLTTRDKKSLSRPHANCSDTHDD